MKISGLIDNNSFPTKKFVELNQNNGKVFRFKVDICTEKEGVVHCDKRRDVLFVSRTLREQGGKIISVKHLTELK
ncbi:MAG: hypothetical protein ACRCZ0_06620 [Cetobacterium sp.]